jgi:hypothetical protein
VEEASETSKEPEPAASKELESAASKNPEVAASRFHSEVVKVIPVKPSMLRKGPPEKRVLIDNTTDFDRLLQNPDAPKGTTEKGATEKGATEKGATEKGATEKRMPTDLDRFLQDSPGQVILKEPEELKSKSASTTKDEDAAGTSKDEDAASMSTNEDAASKDDDWVRIDKNSIPHQPSVEDVEDEDGKTKQ